MWPFFFGLVGYDVLVSYPVKHGDGAYYAWRPKPVMMGAHYVGFWSREKWEYTGFYLDGIGCDGALFSSRNVER